MKESIKATWYRRRSAIQAIYYPFTLTLLCLTASLWLPVLLVGAFILALDTWARWKEYKALKESQCHYTAYRMRSSRCGRNAAVAAIPDMKKKFDTLGYKHYHWLPDDTPRCFFSFSFWRSVVGIDKRI